MSFNGLNLLEPGDEARGISVVCVSLRWDADPISQAELIQHAMQAVQQVDARFNKDVWDVKILLISQEGQFVQLAVRANYQSPDEQNQISRDLQLAFSPPRTGATGSSVTTVPASDRTNATDAVIWSPEKKWLAYGFASAIVFVVVLFAAALLARWVSPPPPQVANHSRTEEKSNLSPAGTVLGAIVIAGMMGAFCGGLAGVGTSMIQGARKGMRPASEGLSNGDPAAMFNELLYGSVWTDDSQR